MAARSEKFPLTYGIFAVKDFGYACIADFCRVSAQRAYLRRLECCFRTVVFCVKVLVNLRDNHVRFIDSDSVSFCKVHLSHDTDVMNRRLSDSRAVDVNGGENSRRCKGTCLSHCPSYILQDGFHLFVIELISKPAFKMMSRSSGVVVNIHVIIFKDNTVIRNPFFRCFCAEFFNNPHKGSFFVFVPAFVKSVFIRGHNKFEALKFIQFVGEERKVSTDNIPCCEQQTPCRAFLGVKKPCTACREIPGVLIFPRKLFKGFVVADDFSVYDKIAFLRDSFRNRTHCFYVVEDILSHLSVSSCFRTDKFSIDIMKGTRKTIQFQHGDGRFLT